MIARFMGPTWGPPGADRTQVGPMWTPWKLLSGLLSTVYHLWIWLKSRQYLCPAHWYSDVVILVKIFLSSHFETLNWRQGWSQTKRITGPSWIHHDLVIVVQIWNKIAPVSSREIWANSGPFLGCLSKSLQSKLNFIANAQQILFTMVHPQHVKQPLLGGWSMRTS